ncbi:MAG TPA: sigma 54-interacting transcriptional regulator [Blastocatellia bacterium]|nr:sigma 54-interacting transcriptional regulator [Blastocatellia bacterium]
MVERKEDQSADAFALKYRGLLDVSESIVSYRDLSELFHELAAKLRQVVDFDFVGVVLYDQANNVMRFRLIETRLELKIDPPDMVPFEETPAAVVFKTGRPLLIDPEDTEYYFPRVSEAMRLHGIRTYYTLPLVSSGQNLGIITFGCVRPSAYSDDDLTFIEQVTKQVAVAVDNALNFEKARAAEQQLTRERDRLQLLLEVNNAVASHLDLHDLLRAISGCLRKVIHHNAAALTLYEPETRLLRVHALDFSTRRGSVEEGVLIPFEGSPGGHALTTGRTLLVNRIDPEMLPRDMRQHAISDGLRSGLCAPLISHGRMLGTLDVVSLVEDAFTEEDAELLTQIANQFSIAVENALAFREIEALKNKLAEEKLYLEEEIKSAQSFEKIIGQSPALTRILKQVETVAPTGSTVLIQGETGTGKELIARAIHNLSDRRERTMVKLNCSAIPTGLLESELFGHERGAFTGAIAQRAGRFELAHKGTLFLDEVGDIPLELQPKLLRVLQEQEFERLGSTRTIRVDVRLVAATNCDLAQMAAEKKYRSDLYYRLNVFPVHIPPLRERPEDIPLLVRFFAQQFARRMKKRIESIPAEAVHALLNYSWPGNVRELENFIERAVILSKGPELEIPLAEIKPSASVPPPQPSAAQHAPAEHVHSSKLEDAEREHILRILTETNWVVGGPTGAAARLGMKRTTLQSRMRKLNITRQS